MGFYKRLLLSICLMFSSFYIFSMGQATSSPGNRLADRRSFYPEEMYLDEESIKITRRIESVAVLKKVVLQETCRLPKPVSEQLREPLIELPFANEEEIPDQKSYTAINFFDCCAQSYNQRPPE
ncbi:MAG: hypothetical protein NTU89_02785 [Candidatus Dependentiae bacterium]|nr:hypothetical protein [Candidatus Dependentiae bacterium]